MVKNRPRIKPRIHEWLAQYLFIRLKIRGWYLGESKVNALRELQSASGEELSALMPSILDKAFKGEL